MTTLLLQVEIDSDAHPELHAVLSAVGRASLRPERLRQLAAGGIIWEHLRAQPRLDAGASVPMAEKARALDHSALQRTLAQAQDAPAHAPDPPVLQDIVDMTAHPSARSRSRERAATDVCEPAPAAVTTDPGAPPGSLPAPEGATTASVPSPAATATARRDGPRSRLLLMKERGLFKNA